MRGASPSVSWDLLLLPSSLRTLKSLKPSVLPKLKSVTLLRTPCACVSIIYTKTRGSITLCLPLYPTRTHCPGVVRSSRTVVCLTSSHCCEDGRRGRRRWCSCRHAHDGHQAHHHRSRSISLSAPQTCVKLNQLDKHNTTVNYFLDAV